jgi:hypothetical protein
MGAAWPARTPGGASHDAITGGGAMRGFLVYLVLLPGAVMIVLGVLRFRFARRFWRKMYILGLVWVALVLVRLVVLLALG